MSTTPLVSRLSSHPYRHCSGRGTPVLRSLGLQGKEPFRAHPFLARPPAGSAPSPLPDDSVGRCKGTVAFTGDRENGCRPSVRLSSRELRSLWVSTELLSGSSPEPYVCWPPSASHLCRISRSIPRSGRGECYLLGPFSVHRQTTLEDRLGLAKLELRRTTSNQ